MQTSMSHLMMECKIKLTFQSQKPIWHPAPSKVRISKKLSIILAHFEDISFNKFNFPAKRSTSALSMKNIFWVLMRSVMGTIKKYFKDWVSDSLSRFAIKQKARWVGEVSRPIARYRSNLLRSPSACVWMWLELKTFWSIQLVVRRHL